MDTEHCCHSCGHQPCDVTKQLREALKFYADPERYKMDPDSGFIRIQYDGGEAARLILAAADMADLRLRIRALLPPSPSLGDERLRAFLRNYVSCGSLATTVDGDHACAYADDAIRERLCYDARTLLNPPTPSLGGGGATAKSVCTTGAGSESAGPSEDNPPSLEPGLVEGHSGNVERRSMRGTLTSEALSGDAVPPGTSSEPHTARES